MNLSDQMTKLGKRMDDALDGVLAEQIGTNSRIDDLDHQIGDVRDLLLRVISLLAPAEDAGGGCAPSWKAVIWDTSTTITRRKNSPFENIQTYDRNQNHPQSRMDAGLCNADHRLICR